MNLINPRLTLQNIEGDKWLTTFEHTFNSTESVTFTVETPKDANQTVKAVNHSAILRAIELLQVLADRLD